MKPLFWIGSAQKDVRKFPDEVKQEIGYALYLAQAGDTSPSTKVLKGFGGATVVEVVSDHESNAYRAVYTVRFRDAVYVLHAFQKKSKQGIATPQRDIQLIKQRLDAAEAHYRIWQAQKGDVNE